MFAELSPWHLSALEGRAYWFLNTLCTGKATTESTKGAFSMKHQIAPPDMLLRTIFIMSKNEAFYVLEGEYTFICDGVKTAVGPGGYIFLPRGVPHDTWLPAVSRIFSMSLRRRVRRQALEVPIST